MRIPLLVQAVTEYVGTVLHNLHAKDHVQRVADFTFQHPISVGLLVLVLFLLQRAIWAKR
jgi:hypothetical protein